MCNFAVALMPPATILVEILEFVRTSGTIEIGEITAKFNVQAVDRLYRSLGWLFKFDLLRITNPPVVSN